MCHLQSADAAATCTTKHPLKPTSMNQVKTIRFPLIVWFDADVFAGPGFISDDRLYRSGRAGHGLSGKGRTGSQNTWGTCYFGKEDVDHAPGFECDEGETNCLLH
ncbi:hypothetical protein BaRGS_00010191 [Batillaria attramentaria]|uniref:Uncharacterized protein n=1 Tax=Batillaria attramentaria TaxID=370345 RepID=A0ABD0LH14_9CAEN